MKHEGPHPDEALPEGEKTMELEELEFIADLMLGLQEMRSRVSEDSVTPQMWQIIRNAKRRLVNKAFESFKQDPSED